MTDVEGTVSDEADKKGGLATTTAASALFRPAEEARGVLLFEYIEVCYNHQRCHSSLGYQSLAGYEALIASHSVSLVA